MRLVVAALATGRLRFSDVSAPLLDQWLSQRGVVDGRTHVQARVLARVCVLRFGVALQAIVAIGSQFLSLPSRAEVWRMDSLRNVLEMKSVKRSSCHTVTLAGAPGPVCTLLHTCWSLDDVLATHFNSRVQVFSCLRSVGHKCGRGVKS